MTDTTDETRQIDRTATEVEYYQRYYDTTNETRQTHRTGMTEQTNT
ncbi:MAG: hypothetical protein HQK96_04645 [Nitrospirae bacterium]|nr:hypothetical protein [Nitrospirota bacterium]